MIYDLEERTTKFGEKIVLFAKSLEHNEITRPLIKQLIEASTSIGANYREANEAASKKDFRNKICIGKKEANETKHWLRLIWIALPDKEVEGKLLFNEAHEYVLIFAKIIRTTDTNLKNRFSEKH